MEVSEADIVLCRFYFSDFKSYKNRPVIVFKDNLPFDDFVAIPISSKTKKLFRDEFVIDNSNLFEGELPKSSKAMLRKTFVVSKSVVLKKYGSLNQQSFKDLQKRYCDYFNCTS